MLHLVFTFQAGKLCDIEPKIQIISSTGLLPRPFSHSISICPFFVACAREKQYGGDQLHSTEEAGGLGGRARGDDEVEGGLGCKV